MNKNSAIFLHMLFINSVENRPFTFLDFLQFEVRGAIFRMAHGSFRNKISYFLKRGIIYVVYYSRIAHYGLTGIKFKDAKKSSKNHVVVPSPVTTVTEDIAADKLLSYVSTLDSTADAIHDIHLKLFVLGIYNLVSSYPKYGKSINFRSKDIQLEKLYLDNLRICITIHKTNTVTITVACSKFPIILNEVGLRRLSNALEAARTKLIRLVEECGGPPNNGVIVPDYMSWLVTLWHFGKDKFQNEWPAKGYAVSWGRGCEVLRAYIKGKYVSRAERQESPNKPLGDALKKKMERF